MKKWCGLLAVLVLVSVSFVAMRRSEDAAVQVQGQRLVQQRVEQTVTCSGVVEAGEQRGVFAEAGCVIGDVLVEEGQAVSPGDVVATVDKHATRQMQQERSVAALSLATMPEEICAQTDGIVLAVTAAEGEWLEGGMPCVLIAEREDLQVRIAIREKHLTEVKRGQSVTVSGVGLQNETYSGTLEEISSAVSSTGSGAAVEGVVRLSAGQADESFRLGLSAKAKIVTHVTEAGVLIPYEAVLKEEAGSYIFVAVNGKAKRYALSQPTELAEGVLVDDRELVDAVVITQPQSISAGEAVSVKVKEAET